MDGLTAMGGGGGGGVGEMLVGHAARYDGMGEPRLVSVQGLVVMMAFLAVVASDKYGFRRTATWRRSAQQQQQQQRNDDEYALQYTLPRPAGSVSGAA
ncbi:hypothetical protein CSOJ01_06141 [Colletotrichum sojae]|uniref:Uncharacterized protein n=1 Tax=Colletotrichum sojae TaxID=2175907 RepID=A0A8H6JCY2_9PEZI|nr:hypothetical protein CSOJ01_06141 [Colletotrichum sojae]